METMIIILLTVYLAVTLYIQQGYKYAYLELLRMFKEYIKEEEEREQK